VNELWADYRAAWRRAAWLIPMPIVGAILTVLGIIGTVERAPVAILFIPGVLVLLAHHFLAQRVNQ
jgi:hypothetical protein